MPAGAGIAAVASAKTTSRAEIASAAKGTGRGVISPLRSLAQPSEPTAIPTENTPKRQLATASSPPRMSRASGGTKESSVAPTTQNHEMPRIASQAVWLAPASRRTAIVPSRLRLASAPGRAGGISRDAR